MTALGDAITEVCERMLAMSEGATPNGPFTPVQGEPQELMRRVLSGYVPLPDTDQAVEYLETGILAICVAANHARSEDELRIGVGMLAAQFLAVGVACARREADDEEGTA